MPDQPTTTAACEWWLLDELPQRKFVVELIRGFVEFYNAGPQRPSGF